MFDLGRCAAVLAIIVAGACTTAMNWRFSYQLGNSEWDSYTWAIFSVALDVCKWLMLPLAATSWRDNRLRSAAAISIWLVATIYSFTAAIGFAALNRETTIAERMAQTELHKTLDVMKQSPRWQSSAACADATTPPSKEFCARYAAVQVKLRDNPGEADPQSALFARITGIPVEKMRVILAVFLAITCEVVSAFGFFAITAPLPKPEPRPTKTRMKWSPPGWPMPWARGSAPVAPRHATSRHGAP